MTPISSLHPYERCRRSSTRDQTRHRRTNNPFQSRNRFCRKVPAAFHPNEAIQGTAARAKPPAGAGAQPQICTMPGPGTPMACPHIGSHTRSQNHHPMCLPGLGASRGARGAAPLLLAATRASPRDGKHASQPRFPEKTTAGADFRGAGTPILACRFSSKKSSSVWALRWRARTPIWGWGARTPPPARVTPLPPRPGTAPLGPEGSFGAKPLSCCGCHHHHPPTHPGLGVGVHGVTQRGHSAIVGGGHTHTQEAFPSSTQPQTLPTDTNLIKNHSTPHTPHPTTTPEAFSGDPRGTATPSPTAPRVAAGHPLGVPPPKASSTQISPGALPWALRRGQGEPPGWGPARLGSARLRIGSGSAPGGGRAPPPAPQLAPPGSARPRCPAGSCSPGGESRATKRGLAAIWALNGIKKYPPHPL